MAQLAEHRANRYTSILQYVCNARVVSSSLTVTISFCIFLYDLDTYLFGWREIDLRFCFCLRCVCVCVRLTVGSTGVVYLYEAAYLFDVLVNVGFVVWLLFGALELYIYTIYIKQAS